jgi:hypothetical protein
MRVRAADGPKGSNLKRYVSFYFTNFPAQLSIFYLRKGFEVCGMLEDVYVARKRNRFGEPYGFVKFSNVRDITKMTKALNVVCFGQFRIRASVAKFDRTASGVEKRSEEERPGLPKGVVTQKAVHPSPARQAKSLGGDSKIKGRDEAENPDQVKKGAEVHVGEFVLKLGNQRRRPASHERAQNEQLAPKGPDAPAGAAQRKESSILVRSYRSKSEDVQWARHGLVATVINGEAIPVVQNRITDAGFEDLVITPMGADKVFLRRTEGGDVRALVAGAVDFFKLIFSNWMRWDDDGRSFQRGAWVRLYGVPLSAWNVDFFKLCVFECGRFIRADSCSAEKDRLDFARVLIATSDLAIVSRVERVLVDGAQVAIKIVEEWGYAMGEDTCLFEEENGSEASQNDEAERHGEPEDCHNAEVLVDKITAVEEDEGRVDAHVQGGGLNHTVAHATAKGSEEGGGGIEEVCSPGCTVASLSPGVGSPAGSTIARVSNVIDGVGARSRLNPRATSCPPSEDRRDWPGPWSWEWLKDHNHEEAGVIFSASKRARNGDPCGGRTDTNSRKAGGVLRHPVHSLKKLARLPCKDRGEALKALGRCVRKRRAGVQGNSSNMAGGQAFSDASSTSGANDDDWRNWVAVHGNDELAVEDVRDVGQSIGVKLRGGQENMFRVLSRKGLRKEKTG